MKQMTKKEKIKKDIVEIGKEVKSKLNKEFEDCKWSVTTERYSGGQNLEIVLLKAPFRAFKNWEEVSEDIKYDVKHNIIRRNLKKELGNIKNAEINKHHLDKENKQRITDKAYKVMKRAREMIEHYNYDNSKPQEDYFDVNFYYSLKIGRYNKKFKQSG